MSSHHSKAARTGPEKSYPSEGRAAPQRETHLDLRLNPAGEHTQVPRPSNWVRATRTGAASDVADFASQSKRAAPTPAADFTDFGAMIGAVSGAVSA